MPWSENEIIPARMLNEYAYCPRLGYLMWVEGLFADNADTVHGRFVHRRVDREPKRPRKKKAEAGEDELLHHRSELLTGDACGLTAKIDLIEVAGERVTPVDYKRSKRPHTAQGAWEPERVQLCAQGLILRDNGYICDEGVLYFAGSRERVRITFDDTLVARTHKLAEEFRKAACAGTLPPPLDDSPKCPRCSLAALCLPDETRFLAADAAARGPVRPLAAGQTQSLPLYVTEPGARVGKSGEVLQAKLCDETLATARLPEISSVVLFGPAQISTQAVQALCSQDIPVCYFSSGGWFYGLTHGFGARNVDLRRRQHRAADDPKASLDLAKAFVVAKIANQRTLLRRNHSDAPDDVLQGMKEDARQAARAESMEALLGLEGIAARRYFGAFDGMLKVGDLPGGAFTFEGRNKRPPRDPINALLSFGYALLTRELTIAAFVVGFDPFLGFYHQVRHGKPSLALDLMEEFRPLVVDSAVLTVVNNGEVQRGHFVEALGGIAMTPEGRRAFLRAFERRLAHEITHPLFGYRISYRRLFEVQTRLLARHLCGEIPAYPAFTTR
ncbi:MAG: CRISPR-associated endonuclease Cas1 [Acidobacteriota bacterium]